MQIKYSAIERSQLPPILQYSKQNSPNVIFNFWIKELFLLGPPVTSAVLCWHELLPCAGLFASCWQNCSHMVYPCPHTCAPIRMLWPTHLPLLEPDLMLNELLACSSGSSDLYCAPVLGKALTQTGLFWLQMIECQFELARYEGEFTGPGSRLGRGITNDTGARVLFHQDSIPLPLIPVSQASFPSSAHFLLPCTGRQSWCQDHTLTDFQRRRAPASLSSRGEQKDLDKNFGPQGKSSSPGPITEAWETGSGQLLL